VTSAMTLVSGMCHKRGVPYKPQTQGANETRHRRMKTLIRGQLEDYEGHWPYHVKWVQTMMNETTDAVTKTTPAHYFRGRRSALQIPYNEDLQPTTDVPWLERLKRVQEVVYPHLREIKNIDLLKKQKRWDNTHNIQLFEVGDIVKLTSRYMSKNSLSNRHVGPYKISYHDKKSDTYELNNLDGSSALNLDSHRVPTSDITLSRTHDSVAPFDREEFKDIIGCETREDVTYYKTRFHDDTIL